MTKLTRSVVCLLFIYLFFFQIVAVWQFTIDDTFISLKYAKNWVQYGTIIWHPTMPVVEGYSNFSFVAIAALAIKLGLSPVITLKLVGVLMLAVSVISLYHLSRLWLTPRYAFIPCFWLLWYRGEIIWSVSGLETTTFQALILLAVYCLLRGLAYLPVNQKTCWQFVNRSSSIRLRFFVCCGLLLSLAGLTRPEAPAVMIALFLCTLTERKALPCQTKALWRGILITVAIILVIFAPYFIWRWHYFGHFFPNSVNCKWLADVTVGELDWDYIKLVAPLLLLALPYCYRMKDKRVVFLIAPSILYLILLYDADSVVGFYNRHFLTAWALILPLPVVSFAMLANSWLTDAFTRRSLVYTLSFLSALLLIPGFNLASYQQFAKGSQQGITLRNELIDWLDKILPSDAEIVLGDCGQIPYMTDFQVIDSYCLNNPLMTEKPIDNSFERFVKWVLTTKKPKAIILMAWHDKGKVTKAPAAIAFQASKQFYEDYQFKKEFNSQGKTSHYSYRVYLQSHRQ